MARTSKFVRINGNLVELVTIAGFANIVGKSRPTLLRWEENGLIPKAPISLGETHTRYYTKRLCDRLKPLIAKFPSNRPPSPDMITEVNKLFKEEIEHLNSKNDAN